MTFEDYVHRRLPELVKIAQSICQDRSLGEDLVQDVLIKLFDRWSTVQAAANPDAYVNRMLVNEFLSWRRKWARLIPFADAGFDLVDISGDHAQAYADRDALRQRLAGLPDRQRIVITLRYLADLPDAEIADALGCKESTVRVHVSRALATLRVTPRQPAEPHPIGGHSEHQ